MAVAATEITQDIPDVLRGANPLLAEGEPITIAGRDYRWEAFGLEAVFEVANILKNAASFGIFDALDRLGPQLVNVENAQGYVALLAPFLGLPGVYNQVLQFISGHLTFVGADGETDKPTLHMLKDPRQFPAASILDIVDALGRHPDVLGFFSSGALLRMQENPLAVRLFALVQELLPKKPPGPNPPMGGS